MIKINLLYHYRSLDEIPCGCFDCEAWELCRGYGCNDMPLGPHLGDTCSECLHLCDEAIELLSEDSFELRILKESGSYLVR